MSDEDKYEGLDFSLEDKMPISKAEYRLDEEVEEEEQDEAYPIL